MTGRCTRCGGAIRQGARFCDNCAQPVADQPLQPRGDGGDRPSTVGGSRRLQAVLLLLVLLVSIGTAASSFQLWHSDQIGVYVRHTPRLADTFKAFDDGTRITVVGVAPGESRTSSGVWPWFLAVVWGDEPVIGWVPQPYTATNVAVLLVALACAGITLVALLRLVRAGHTSVPPTPALPPEQPAPNVGQPVTTDGAPDARQRVAALLAAREAALAAERQSSSTVERS